MLYRKLPQGRHQKTVRGPRAKSRHAEQCARREREPWLLAASPSLSGKKGTDLLFGTENKSVPFFVPQIQPDTFEYAVNWIVDHDVDLSVFDAR